MKRLIVLLFALTLLCSFALPASAHDVPQERTDCSIQVIVRYNGADVNGGTLTAIKVGYVAEDDGNYFFCREKDDVLLEDIQDPAAPAALEKFYANNKGSHSFYKKTVTVKNGKGSFTGLPTGLYLIVQEEASQGYSKLNSFLVSVPYMEDGQYRYDVTAAIKSELEREPETTVPPSTQPEDPKLPQTGQLNWPVPVLAAAGLGLFTLGLILRKKEEPYEK